MLSLLLALVMVLCMMPDMGLKAEAAAMQSVSISEATYHSNGALASIKASFTWPSANVSVPGRLVLMTKYLNDNDLSNMGTYGGRFSTFDAAVAYDTAVGTAGTFGIVSKSEENQISVGVNNMTITFADGLIPLEAENKFYYVYQWAYYGSRYYPDNLVAVINVNNGVVKYTPATGRNTYDEGAFQNVVAKEKYSVTIESVPNMTLTSGRATQTDIEGTMEPVVYTADNGYFFPEDYVEDSSSILSNIKVTRVDETKIKIEGMPIANATIKLAAPTLKYFEDIVFPYAYDVQRTEAYPEKDQEFRLHNYNNPNTFDNPLINAVSRVDPNASWTLTNVGTYELMVGKELATTNLGTIVSNVATAYHVADSDTIIVHELKRNGAHVAYGVVIVWDTDNAYALYLGDNLSGGGAGYLLTLNATQPREISAGIYGIMVKATQIATGLKQPKTYAVNVVENVDHGDAYANNNVANWMEGDTVTIKVDPDDGYVVESVISSDVTVSYVGVENGVYTYSFAMPPKTVTVNVVYKQNAHTVTFKEEGQADVTRKVNHGATVSDIPALTGKTGHTGKWMYNNAEFTDQITITSDIIVTAEYTPIPYTVTFTAGGIKEGEATVAYNATIANTNGAEIPAVPSKEGYLGKWMYNGAEFTAETKILGNTDVVAVYTINEVEKITFLYAYDVQRSPAFPKENDPISLTGLKEPLIGVNEWGTTNAGSWTLTKIGVYGITKGTERDTTYLKGIISSVKEKYPSINEDNIVLHELKNGDDHVAYGVLVTYDAAKGIAIFVGDTWGNGGAGYLLSLEPQTQEPVTGTASIDIEDVMVAPPTMYDVTIAAAAKVNGTVTAVTKAVAGDTVTINVAPATGYEIVKVTYNDGSAHDVVLTAGKYTFTMPATAVEINVTYEKIEYTVTYMIDGQVKDTEKVKYQEDAQNFPTIPAKTGYDQIAPTWDHDGKNITGDTTITAVYTINTYTVTYVADGRGVKTEVVEWGKDATAPTVPAKDGYTGAWSKEAKNVKEDLIIEAVYTKIKQDQPEKPVEPEKPEEPTQPTPPASNPDTGDNSHLGLWIAMALASCVALVVIDRKKRYYMN